MITCTKSLHCLARLTALYLTFKRCSAIIANVKMKSSLLTKIEPNLQIYSSIHCQLIWYQLDYTKLFTVFHFSHQKIRTWQKRLIVRLTYPAVWAAPDSGPSGGLPNTEQQEQKKSEKRCSFTGISCLSTSWSRSLMPLVQHYAPPLARI